MDMRNDPDNTSGRRWSDLAARARGATAPELDLCHAVLAEIRREDSQAANESPPSLLASVNELMAHTGMKPALAGLTALVATVGYLGFRGLEWVELVNSLII